MQERLKYERHVKKGEVLFREGDIGEEMYFIRKGKIKISKGEEEQEKVLAILKEGEFFGEMSLIDRSPRSATATAIEDTELLLIDKETFLQKINETPLIAYVVETLIKRLRICDEKLKYLKIESIEHRAMQYLISRAKEKGGEKNIEIKGETIDNIADIISGDSEKVKNLIKRLENIGMITRDADGNFIIKDLNELKEFFTFLKLRDKFKE